MCLATPVYYVPPVNTSYLWIVKRNRASTRKMQWTRYLNTLWILLYRSIRTIIFCALIRSQTWHTSWFWKKNYKARNLPKFLCSMVREVEFFILRSHKMERSLCEVTSLVTFCSRLRKEEVQAYWFLKGKNRTNLYSKPIIWIFWIR